VFDRVVPGWATSILVARDRELETATAELTAGRGVVVVGSRGSGRTALAAAAAAAAERRGDAPLWIVATPSLSTVPFGAVGWMLGDGAVPTEPAAMFGRLVSALRRHGGSALTVVVIDDAHLLDERSADAVIQALAGRGVSLVATTDRDPPPSWLARLTGDGFTRTVRLAPLARADVAAVAERLLGGAVAPTTAELLRLWSGGLPGLVHALVDRGRAAGRFRATAGRWWWTGPALVPAEVDGIVDRMLAGADPAVSDALDIVVLGEPVELDVAEELTGGAALHELDRRGLVTTHPSAGRTFVHVRSPLVATQRLAAMTPIRRRRAARQLLAAVPSPQTAVDHVRRAMWHLDGDVPAPADLLLGASAMLSLTDPAWARRLADANRSWNSGVRALVAAVDVHVEAGEPGDARRMLDQATETATATEELALVESAEITTRLFADRRPRSARHAVAAARNRRGGDDPELRSLDALISLLESRPDAAADHARQVLERADATGVDRLRAGLVSAASLILSGRTTDGVATAERLLLDAAAHPAVSPTNVGMLRAVVAFGWLWRAGPPSIPPADPATGRHPAPPYLPSHARPASGAAPFEWPFMRGVVAHLRGDHDVAVTELRDAAVLQRGGKGLFHAEAAAWLVVALCDAGNVIEAVAAMAQFPTRHLAVIPGLEAWARGVLACARGDTDEGARLLRAAAAEARQVGAELIEARYLADLADRRPDERELVGRLDELVRALDAPVPQCLCELAVARLNGDLGGLVDGAERLAAFGFQPRAMAAATAARRLARRTRDGESGRRAAAVIRLLRDDPTPRAARANGGPALTRRETEVAELAAGGLADREIAARLFVSVRTVESHLASVYRKLGVVSRNQLDDVLAPLEIAG
jgi:DNA-binding CsgD family transcriptional regulator